MPNNTLNKKQCIKCKQYKETDEFEHPQEGVLSSWCLDCIDKDNKEVFELTKISRIAKNYIKNNNL